MQNKSVLMSTSQLVWDYWERNAKEHSQSEAIIHWDALDKPFRWNYASLYQAALIVAENLLAQGVKSGDICSLIIRHNKYFYPIYMGIVAIGAIPTVLAYPNPRIHPDKFVYGLTGISQKSGLDWIITERELEAVINPLIRNENSTIKGSIFALEWLENEPNKTVDYKKISEMRHKITFSMPFLLQFSSGTTGLQKGIVLSHKAIVGHVKRYSESLQLSAQDKIVSWLPLYHDMGLIAAFQMPLIYGIPTIQIDPFQWISAPMILFQAISEERATLTWLPNFAYNFLSERIYEEDMDGIILSSMRMFINCSEVVRPESHEIFLKSFSKYGVKKTMFSACYAMAETTFAVTQVAPGEEPAVLTLDRNLLSKRIVKLVDAGNPIKLCASSGKPVSGCILKIIDPKGHELAEDQIGVIAIQSVSLFDGYRNNSEKTNQVMKDNWYLTGDLGFCHNGEYYILGREDDVVIVAGKNIYPEDIEGAVNKVNGVIPGRVVAFGIEDLKTGTQQVCVIAETSCESELEKDTLKLEIIKAGMAIDVTISMVVFVPLRWLIKSSSGKLSRKANKERIKKFRKERVGNNNDFRTPKGNNFESIAAQRL